MKKLLFIALLAMIMVGCRFRNTGTDTRRVSSIIIIDEQGDSCEYYPTYGHKGNCKFCTERNRKMIKAQIDSALIETFD